MFAVINSAVMWFLFLVTYSSIIVVHLHLLFITLWDNQ